MTKYLFIGGCNDGQSIEVIDTFDKVYAHVPTLEDLTRLHTENKINSIGDIDYIEEIYVRSSICGNSKKFNIMALKGLTEDAVIETLINQYTCNAKGIDMKQYLFIGGSRDGQVFEIDELGIVEEAGPQVYEEDYEKSSEISVETGKKEIYVPAPIRGNSKVFNVMTLLEYTGDDVMQKLIDRYSSN